MKDTEALLTVLVPVFNEVENIPRLFEQLSEYLLVASCKMNVLFIDDGSTDGGSVLLDRVCTPQSDFEVLHLDQNYGLSTALKAGFDRVSTPWFGYLDADLQTSPFDFELLLPYLDRYDLITGVRQKRRDGIVKRLSSRIANAIRRSVTHDGASDTGCPLKIVRTSLFGHIPFYKGMHRFLPALVLLVGGTVKEVAVPHFERLAGQSKYRLWNRLLGPGIDLLAFGWIRSRYIRYKIANR